MIEFKHSNIDPNVICFDDAMQRKSYLEAEGYFHAIQEEIDSAATIFGKAQVADLNAKQAERKEKLSRIHDVVPLHVIGGQNVDPKVMAEMAPVGIENMGGDDCWANAALQLAANAPRIAGRLIGPFAKLIQDYYAAQMHGHQISGVNSQKARKELLGVAGQQDAAEGLRKLLGAAEFGSKIYEEISGNKAGREQEELEPMLQLDIPQNYSTMQELVGGAFAPAKLEDNRTKTTKLELAPDDLVVQVNRVQGKKDFSVVQSENITISSKLTRYNESDTSYELKGCIIHRGKGAKSGHYVAMVKKPDGWYLANDNVVTKMTDYEASQELRKGYIFHYAKVKPSRCCQDIASAIARTVTQIFTYPYNAIRRFTGIGW